MPKFKVHVQQYVEETATIEVEAEDAGMAAQVARKMMRSDEADDIEWGDGDDVIHQDIYAVHDGNGNVVWER